MLNKATFFGTLAGLGFLLGTISGVLAAEMPAPHNMPSQSSSTQFQRIDQPLANKIAVTLGGLGLIGLELWWFLFSKPKSQRVEAHEGIQEVTVTVDGGYAPSQIVVQAGQLVRLNFLRRDPNSCLEEVRLPDFHIAQSLSLNEVTTVEFTPTEPGSYEFVCGMNMFRGVIEVKPSNASSNLANSSDSVSTPIKQIGHTMPMSEEMKANMMMNVDLGAADAQFDLRFINVMLPHHEGAVTMAKEALQKSDRPEVKELAQNIITSQQQEISQMKQWKKAWYGQ